MRKRLLVFGLITAMLISGCGAAKVTESVMAKDESESVEEAPAKEETFISKAIEEASDSPYTFVQFPEASEPMKEEEKVEETVEETESMKFAKGLKFGWNLGNTLDATDGSGLASEVSWGMPYTTKEMIHFVKECGFTSIRIPVSWGKHTSGTNHTIDAAWMDRVNEIVDWALEEDLFVIINSHHDCDYYYPSDEKLDASLAYIEDIWTQVADRFKDYDERLVFESMNEPRLMNTAIEWWWSGANTDGIASIKCINELNNKFVEVVRNSGSNNATRYLMVPSYAANHEFAFNSNFTIPEDSANHIMVSVHSYTPYDFAGNADGYSEWSTPKTSELSFLTRLYKKFAPMGIGVVVGEFGATNKDNDEDRIAWAKDFTERASKNGISCFVWDNGQTGVGAENFGLIDRNNLKVFFPDLLDAYLTYYR